MNAKTWCEEYLYKNYTIGQLCKAFPNVDIQQEIKTCMEDIQVGFYSKEFFILIDGNSLTLIKMNSIWQFSSFALSGIIFQITGAKRWAPSARSALNEQCLEEIQRNSSIPDDVANQIEGAICVNSCSGNGDCVKGEMYWQGGRDVFNIFIQNQPERELLCINNVCNLQLQENVTVGSVGQLQIVLCQTGKRRTYLTYQVTASVMCSSWIVVMWLYTDNILYME